MSNKKINSLILFVIAVIVEVIIAVFIKDDFVRPYLGDIIAIFALYYLLGIFFNKNNYLPFIAFVIAIIVEITQLFHLTTLLNVNNPILKTMLGGTFDFVDILCYFIGTIIIYILNRKSDD